MTEAAPTAGDARPVVRIVVAVAVLPLVVAAAGAALVWSRRDALPAEVAIHWGVDGAADGFASPGVVVAMVAGFGVVFAAAGLWLSLAGPADPLLVRVLAVTTTGVTGFVTVLATWLVTDQRGLADAAEAEAGASRFLGSFAAGVLLAAVAAWTVPRWSAERGEPAPGDVPRLGVAPGERVAWTRSVATGSGPAAVLVAGVGVTVAAGVLSRQWWMLGVGAALGVVAAVMFSITVTVDRHGLTLRSRLGRPRMHIPLGEVERATVVDVRPLRHFGGYGYRIAAFGPLRGASGYVLRGGSGLLVERRGGRRTVVVVDDAATAAGLLNTLAERAR
ncbi:uncharacterized protein DUF1648 [Haloactinopolyspora alba]|uniref:Uncharacterized protein DUF1648 n=1 Tax=Haloactinopolyspora alba TaxID=648780 RepID=A0A2P8D5F0_9ACTN|nr:DUF1648 domain-containing protein [Haloactinopolyspora alba]PSK92422.1 uncharacterized protein DUF1648 [Haloactinopolyspora alba]